MLSSMQAWELIQTVPPFHATTFQSGLSLNPTRAGLDILQACAHRLLYELNVEGLATGLDVFVEASYPHNLQQGGPLCMKCSLAPFR